MRKFGCFLIILLLLVGVWYWYARVEVPAGGTTTTATSAAKLWQPLSQAHAERGRSALQSLSQPSGPVFANLTAAEAASYIFLIVAKQLPPSLRKRGPGGADEAPKSREPPGRGGPLLPSERSRGTSSPLCNFSVGQAGASGNQ